MLSKELYDNPSKKVIVSQQIMIPNVLDICPICCTDKKRAIEQIAHGLEQVSVTISIWLNFKILLYGICIYCMDSALKSFLMLFHTLLACLSARPTSEIL